MPFSIKQIIKDIDSINEKTRGLGLRKIIGKFHIKEQQDAKVVMANYNLFATDLKNYYDNHSALRTLIPFTRGYFLRTNYNHWHSKTLNYLNQAEKEIMQQEKEDEKKRLPTIRKTGWLCFPNPATMFTRAPIAPPFNIQGNNNNTNNPISPSVQRANL